MFEKKIDARREYGGKNDFELPTPPKECGINGCGQPTGLVEVIVQDSQGHRKKGLMSDYRNGAGAMKEGFSFIRWAPICWDCYSKRINNHAS